MSRPPQIRNRFVPDPSLLMSLRSREKTREKLCLFAGVAANDERLRAARRSVKFIRCLDAYPVLCNWTDTITRSRQVSGNY
jgi:hypothetical protein